MHNRTNFNNFIIKTIILFCLIFSFQACAQSRNVQTQQPIISTYKAPEKEDYEIKAEEANSWFTSEVNNFEQLYTEFTSNPTIEKKNIILNYAQTASLKFGDIHFASAVLTKSYKYQSFYLSWYDTVLSMIMKSGSACEQVGDFQEAKNIYRSIITDWTGTNYAGWVKKAEFALQDLPQKEEQYNKSMQSKSQKGEKSSKTKKK